MRRLSKAMIIAGLATACASGPTSAPKPKTAIPLVEVPEARGGFYDDAGLLKRKQNCVYSEQVSAESSRLFKECKNDRGCYFIKLKEAESYRSNPLYFRDVYRELRVGDTLFSDSSDKGSFELKVREINDQYVSFDLSTTLPIALSEPFEPKGVRHFRSSDTVIPTMVHWYHPEKPMNEVLLFGYGEARLHDTHDSVTFTPQPGWNYTGEKTTFEISAADFWQSIISHYSDVRSYYIKAYDPDDFIITKIRPDQISVHYKARQLCDNFLGFRKLKDGLR